MVERTEDMLGPYEKDMDINYKIHMFWTTAWQPRTRNPLSFILREGKGQSRLMLKVMIVTVRR